MQSLGLSLKFRPLPQRYKCEEAYGNTFDPHYLAGLQFTALVSFFCAGKLTLPQEAMSEMSFQK